MICILLENVEIDLQLQNFDFASPEQGGFLRSFLIKF